MSQEKPNSDAIPKITRDNFLGFDWSGTFYARSRAGRHDDRVRVRTYRHPMGAVFFAASLIGRAANLKARTTEGDVPLLDDRAQPYAHTARALRSLLNHDEHSLLTLYGLPASEDS